MPKQEKQKDDSKKLLKELKALQKIQVRWGVQGKRNAKIMFYNEYGTKDIPERPAFRRTFESRQTQDSISKAAGVAIEQAMAGKKANDAAAVIGEVGLRNLRNVFTSNIQPANAPSTIKKKGAGKNTLYDTGALFRSLGYEVK
jgi:hypothetical protein